MGRVLLTISQSNSSKISDLDRLHIEFLEVGGNVVTFLIHRITVACWEGTLISHYGLMAHCVCL